MKSKLLMMILAVMILLVACGNANNKDTEANIQQNETESETNIETTTEIQSETGTEVESATEVTTEVESEAPTQTETESEAPQSSEEPSEEVAPQPSTPSQPSEPTQPSESTQTDEVIPDEPCPVEMYKLVDEGDRIYCWVFFHASPKREGYGVENRAILDEGHALAVSKWELKYNHHICREHVRWGNYDVCLVEWVPY